MSSHSSQSLSNTLQLAQLEQQHVQMQMHREQEQWERKQWEREETERQEQEEQEIEMVIMAEQARMEEERQRIMMQRELEVGSCRDAAENGRNTENTGDGGRRGRGRTRDGCGTKCPKEKENGR